MQTKKTKLSVGKLSLTSLIMILILLFFIFDLDQLLNLENLKQQQEKLQDISQNYPYLSKLAFLIIYILFTALSLPGAVIMTLAAGALFGVFTGSILVSLASTTGAILAMLAARYLFGDTIQTRYKDKLTLINQGIAKEGGFYLFTLRLIPVIPFFIVNLIMGATRIKTWTYAWVSQLGMLPATIIYVNAGYQLTRINTLKDIVSLPVIGSLVLLGLFPLVIKKLITLYRKNEAKI